MIKIVIKSLSSNLTDIELKAIEEQTNRTFSSDFIFLAKNFHHFFIPHTTDEYVLVAMKNGDKYELETSIDVRQLSDYIDVLKMYDEDENGRLAKDYLPFMITTSRAMLLMGNSKKNTNQIFYYHPDKYDEVRNKGYVLQKQAENYVDFLNNQVYIEKRE